MHVPSHFHIKRKVLMVFLLISVCMCKLTLDTQATVTGSANETVVFNYLTSTMGLNRAAACGAMANIAAESGFNPLSTYTESNGSVSHGICQWNGGRYNNLVNYCSNNGYSAESLTGQLHFLEYELKNSYTGVYNVLISVSETQQGAYDAAFKWCFSFEVPANPCNQGYIRGVRAAANYWPEYGTGVNGGYRTDGDFVWMYLDGTTSSSELNAYIRACTPTECGWKAGTDPSNLPVVCRESLSGSQTVNRMFYRLNEANISWQAGTTYYFQFYYVLNGSTVTSKIYSFRFGNRDISLYNGPVIQTGYLDLNGLLDGAESGSLSSLGTCDVYINGSLAENDVNDYYQELPAGTTWRIDDIRAKDGYSYDGIDSGSQSGTVSAGSTANVRLKFNSCILDINGYLDGKDSGDLGSYGTFDLYINGSPVRENVNDYSQRVTKGSSYEIRSIQAADGYTYDGLHAGSLTGTVGSGRTVVSLSFYKNGELSGDWIETDHLPGNVNDEICEIQYRYASTKVAAASPGAGWTQVAGSATTKYENIGGVYDNDLELPTSDTRVYVGSYYYHYCGASTGVNVEHYNDGVHTDLHIAGDINQFNVSGGPWADDNDPRYLAYEITWKSGQWAGGKATCSAGRSAIWYRKYQYQDRKAVTYYTWEKKTDWQSEQDTSLTPAGYRYRLKDAEDPTITSVTISGVTPSGYTLVCKASDNMGISKAVFVTWTDTETENAPIITEITPEKIDTTVEITADIPIADHSSERDVWYHTKVYVYDQAGHSAEYSDADCKTYIPTLIRSSARKLTLPAGLTEIEASAFEGSIGAGEAILSGSVTKIGSRAFADCGRLCIVYLPDSVTEIAADAFAESSNVVLLCESDNAGAAFARDHDLPYLTGGYTL